MAKLPPLDQDPRSTACWSPQAITERLQIAIPDPLIRQYADAFSGADDLRLGSRDELLKEVAVIADGHGEGEQLAQRLVRVPENGR